MATTVPRPSATDAISYADLYARWERGNWRATEIDFSQDAVDWHNLADRLRQNSVQEKLTDVWVRRVLARDAAGHT